MAKYHLVVLNHSSLDKRQIEIGAHGVSIGRVEGDLVIGSAPELSTLHARVIPDPDGNGLKILDLRSTNGTFLNGERIQASAIAKPGDRIKMGGVEFEIAAAADAAAASNAKKAKTVKKLSSAKKQGFSDYLVGLLTTPVKIFANQDFRPWHARTFYLIAVGALIASLIIRDSAPKLSFWLFYGLVFFGLVGVVFYGFHLTFWQACRFAGGRIAFKQSEYVTLSIGGWTFLCLAFINLTPWSSTLRPFVGIPVVVLFILAAIQTGVRPARAIATGMGISTFTAALAVAVLWGAHQGVINSLFLQEVAIRIEQKLPWSADPRSPANH